MLAKVLNSLRRGLLQCQPLQFSCMQLIKSGNTASVHPEAAAVWATTSSVAVNTINSRRFRGMCGNARHFRAVSGWRMHDVTLAWMLELHRLYIRFLAHVFTVDSWWTSVFPFIKINNIVSSRVVMNVQSMWSHLINTTAPSTSAAKWSCHSEGLSTSNHWHTIG